MCNQIEPIPTAFFAPVGLFSDADFAALNAQWLGEWLYSPGGSFLYRVASGPLCRLYWNEQGKPEPHGFESGWIQDELGRWKRQSANYLSYAIAGGGFITVRWRQNKITVFLEK